MEQNKKDELQWKIANCFFVSIDYDEDDILKILSDFNLTEDEIEEVLRYIDDYFIEDTIDDARINIGWEVSSKVLDEYILPKEEKYPEDNPNQLHLF